MNLSEKLVQELTERIPIGEFVITGRLERAAILHYDMLDDFNLEIIVFRVLKRPTKQQNLGRLKLSHPRKPIDVFLSGGKTIGGRRRQAD